MPQTESYVALEWNIKCAVERLDAGLSVPESSVKVILLDSFSRCGYAFALYTSRIRRQSIGLSLEKSAAPVR